MRVCVSCMAELTWRNEADNSRLVCWNCAPRTVYKPMSQRRTVGPTVPFDETDGGRREDGFRSETNDCTVRAVAVATGSRYADAHLWLQRRGRRMRQGCAFAAIVQVHGSNVLGHKLEIYRLPKASRGVRAAIERNPQLAVGTWIIHSTKHVAVLRDGKLLDSFDSSRKIIDKAWKVVPLEGS